MFTTTRVSVGIAFGPAATSALGEGEGEAEDGADGADGAGVALTRDVFWLFCGSTTQPETKNTDRIKISMDRFMA